MHTWSSKLAALTACLTAVAGVAAGTGSEAILPSCGTASPVFAPWGDTASYALVPGGAFGSDEHIRISYATSMERLHEGVARMAKALAKLSS